MIEDDTRSGKSHKHVETPRGPLGDAIPGDDDMDPSTRGSTPQEDVEDRRNVSTVTPEDYPEAQRAGQSALGSLAPANKPSPNKDR